MDKKDWVISLGRRLLGLPQGRYTITLSITPQGVDWTVTPLGKIESRDSAP
jgi:hypothetical protein